MAVIVAVTACDEEPYTKRKAYRLPYIILQGPGAPHERQPCTFDGRTQTRLTVLVD